jgi:hypothetical protein
MEQGTYGQWKSSGIETRHIKAFTRDELENILTPDKRKRIQAALHIERETANSMDSQLRLIEYVAHCVTARGVLTYVNSDANNRMKVSMTFPILTRTVSTSWTDTANADIITAVQQWLDDYALSGNGTPRAIRMTTRVWRLIRDNAGIKTYFTNFRYSKSDASGGVITREMVSEALGWPPLEIYDERCPLHFTVTTSAIISAGNDVVIPLKEGTFGLNVGDSILIGYNSTKGTWTESCEIKSVSDGVSVTVKTLQNDLTDGTNIVAKPYFFPSDHILFVPEENSNNIEFVRMPFGIQAIGNNVTLLDRYGIYIDAFAGSTEPDLVVYKRFWDKFAWRINPRAYMSIKVIL